MKIVFMLGAALLLCFSPAHAKTVRAYATLERIPDPSGIHLPQCIPAVSSKTWGQRILDDTFDAVGKAVSVLPGAGDDPFNTKRFNQSTCKDLCVVLPSGADFKASGGVTGTDRSGDESAQLSTGLTQTIEWSWAAVTGPSIEQTPRGDVVCYTFKNWSHTYDRSASLIITY